MATITHESGPAAFVGSFLSFRTELSVRCRTAVEVPFLPVFGRRIMSKPRRAVEVTITASADSLEEMGDKLLKLAHEFLQGDSPVGISAGNSSSYRVETAVDNSITHEVFARNLAAYLARPEPPTAAT